MEQDRDDLRTAHDVPIGGIMDPCVYENWSHACLPDTVKFVRGELPSAGACSSRQRNDVRYTFGLCLEQT